MTSLNAKLQQASTLARSEKYEEARQLCREIASAFPSDPESYAKLAYINSREGKYADAVTAITLAIDRNADEPDYFYSRGRYRLAIGENAAAVSDFDDVIRLCARHQNSYYLQPSQFFKAESLIRLGRVDEAPATLELVDDDFETWVDELTSKQDLVQRCHSASRNPPRE